ncbi:MAG: hypothetical protein JO035_08745 [Betaproteobacteria bacterium]|nr:hypothetical protein [Betaproteobacteria bacterium]
MKFTIEVVGDVLRAEVSERETADEARQFFEAIMAEREKTGALSILIMVRDSRPLYKVEDYQLSHWIERVKAIPGLRVAGVAHERDLKSAQDYVTLLASQRDAPMRNFPSEAQAISWLREPR